MCETCWAEKFGSVRFDNESVRAAAKAIEQVYSFHVCGGGLHVQLDDWNLKDSFFRVDSRPVEDGIGGDERLEVEQECFDLMREMTKYERASALALYEGYWG